MKIFWSSLLGLAAMVSSMPSQHQNGTILDGATNNKCSAPEGDGVCQDITNCKGISYPSNLCPYDPTNVQCCVEIACSVPRAGSGYCRSIEKNGCSDGKFYAGFCPGDDDDDDIRCCVQGTNNSSSSSSSPPPLSPPQPQLQPEPRSPCSKTAFNNLMYKESISAFLKSKSAKSPSCFDWSDDGCSWSSEMPSGYYYFSPSCKRHDFGSRNAKKYNWFNEEVKEKIDSQFKDDLYDVCREFSGWESTKGVECRRTADWYLWFVRTFGTKTKRERET